MGSRGPEQAEKPSRELSAYVRQAGGRGGPGEGGGCNGCIELISVSLYWALAPPVAAPRFACSRFFSPSPDPRSRQLVSVLAPEPHILQLCAVPACAPCLACMRVRRWSEAVRSPKCGRGEAGDSSVHPGVLCAPPSLAITMMLHRAPIAACAGPRCAPSSVARSHTCPPPRKSPADLATAESDATEQQWSRLTS